MTGPRPRVKFTYKDYMSAPEDKRYELLDGDLIVVPAPDMEHQDTSRNIVFPLGAFVRERSLGYVYYAPCDVVLSDTDVVQPDLLFISKERSHIITRRNIQGAPDLVIEILSPGTAERDRNFKRRLYERHGVREYWMADPYARTIEVLALGERGFELVAVYHYGEVLTSPLLEGLRLDLREVFQRTAVRPYEG
jgi:Uma2 family endonuclease